MARGTVGGDGGGGGDDDGLPFGGDPAAAERTADALGEADDDTLLALGATVLAELKDRDLLRVLLRHRTDAATAVEVEAVRGGEDGIELLAAGYHAETPDRYDDWVEEADAVHAVLVRAGPADGAADAAAALAAASDEALLLAFDRARDEEDEAEDDEDGIGALKGLDSGQGGGDVGARLAAELLRRGVIQSDETEGA